MGVCIFICWLPNNGSMPTAGAEGEIMIVGRELAPPYNRPPLSKQYVRGEESREDILFRPDDWYSEQRIELRK